MTTFVPKLFFSFLVLLALPPATSFANGYDLKSIPINPPPFGKLIQDVSPWEGVRMQRWRRDDPPVDWLTVWIDLGTPNLGYRVTPIHYRVGPGGYPIQAAYAQTTLDFAKKEGNARIDLAVNTIAYWPFPAFDGTPVFLSEPVWHGDDNQRDPEPDDRGTVSTMLGLFPGRAQIGRSGVLRETGPTIALGGFTDNGILPDAVAVRDGKIAIEDGESKARTMAGTSSDGRVLIFVVADGYNPGVSIGLTPDDGARVLQAAGAHQGIFFDGGGSATLVARDAAGQLGVINRPSGLQTTPGTLRYVAVNLGFTNLRSTGEPLPSIPGWEASPMTVTRLKLHTWSRVHPVWAAVIPCSLLIGSAFVIDWIRKRRRVRRMLSEPSADTPAASGQIGQTR